MTIIENDQNTKSPKQKMAKIENGQNRKLPKQKMNKIENDQRENDQRENEQKLNQVKSAKQTNLMAVTLNQFNLVDLLYCFASF